MNKVCCNCGKKEACEIADGLILCANCEKKGDWHLVQDVHSKRIRWKDIRHQELVDEIIVD
jgi:hypothetical protein